jgi:hypothetical protein
MVLNVPRNSMIMGILGEVARDGIEPPTPAFSGLSDQRLTRQAF